MTAGVKGYKGYAGAHESKYLQSYTIQEGEDFGNLIIMMSDNHNSCHEADLDADLPWEAGYSGFYQPISIG